LRAALCKEGDLVQRYSAAFYAVDHQEIDATL
jgi:hypothetical protein